MKALLIVVGLVLLSGCAESKGSHEDPMLMHCRDIGDKHSIIRCESEEAICYLGNLGTSPNCHLK